MLQEEADAVFDQILNRSGKDGLFAIAFALLQVASSIDDMNKIMLTHIHDGSDEYAN